MTYPLWFGFVLEESQVTLNCWAPNAAGLSSSEGPGEATVVSAGLSLSGWVVGIAAMASNTLAKDTFGKGLSILIWNKKT